LPQKYYLGSQRLSHDSALVHLTLSIQVFLTKHYIPLVSQPPSDDFFLCVRSEKHLRGREISEDARDHQKCDMGEQSPKRRLLEVLQQIEELLESLCSLMKGMKGLNFINKYDYQFLQKV
jgi:hypothetical protein